MATPRNRWWIAAGAAGIVAAAGADYLLSHSWPYLSGLVALIWLVSFGSTAAVERRLRAEPKHFMAAVVIASAVKITVAAAAVIVVVRSYNVAPAAVVGAMTAAYFAYTALELRHLTTLLKNDNPAG